jgi:hypothetical protein
MDLKTLAPELNNNQLKAVYRLVYEDMVGSLPKTHGSDGIPNYDAATVAMLDQVRTAMSDTLNKALEKL